MCRAPASKEVQKGAYIHHVWVEVPRAGYTAVGNSMSREEVTPEEADTESLMTNVMAEVPEVGHTVKLEVLDSTGDMRVEEHRYCQCLSGLTLDRIDSVCMCLILVVHLLALGQLR